MQTLRIFVSSPGDVAAERAAVRCVLDELGGSHLLRGEVNFELVAWDDPYAASPMQAGVTPQDSVNRYSVRPSGCDLTLVILWSRIGTVLPPDMVRADGSRYASGTVWEFEDAINAHCPVLLYRRTSKPQIDVDDADFDVKRSQYAAVNTFFSAFKNADGSLGSGVNSYAEPADFARQLRQHLEAFVKKCLSHNSNKPGVVGFVPEPQETVPRGAMFFISYLRGTDLPRAEALFQSLLGLGVSETEVWFDRQAIEPGQDFRQRILDGIHGCRYFLPLLSEGVNRRKEGFVFFEWHEANYREKCSNRAFVYPLIVDADYKPERYTADVARAWSGIDYGHAPEGVPDCRTVATLKTLVRDARRGEG